MGLFDNLKKKAEQFASDTGKIADKTLKDTSAWTEKAVKDTKTWTQHAIEDTKDWTEKAAKDTKDWTERAVIDSKIWTEQTMKDIGDLAFDTWENKEKYADDLKQWSREMPEKLKDYADNFNVEDFWNKIAETGKKVGQNMIFMALACYYALMEIFNKDKEEKESDINSK